MRIVPTLRQLTIAVWLGWLGLVGLMVGFLVFKVMHPHFLPATVLLAIEMIAALALLIGGVWRMTRGPNRLQALRLLLLGVGPIGFLAGHFLYGLSIGYGRQLDINWPIKMLMPLGESIFDLVARFPYPDRTEGSKVVMISAPLPDAQSLVDAMDRHVVGLEARLGRPIRGRAHWIRGPIMGLQGKAIYGVCMGSTPGTEAPDAEGLASLDRHEVAHVAIASVCPVTLNPPALLSEGWAQANSGHDPSELAVRAWELRDQREGLSLAELTGPEWYSRHELPVYVFGAPLVNYILREFGPERFLTLYVTSRPENFGADVQRILGVSLDELDRAYRADIERMLGPGGSPARNRLFHLNLGPEVAPEKWKAFLDEYLAESDRLLAPYDHVKIKGEFHHTLTDAAGKTNTFVRETEYRRSGKLRSLRTRVPAMQESVLLASPNRSLQASRKRPESPWEIRIDPKRDLDHEYQRIVHRIAEEEPYTFAAGFLLDLIGGIFQRADASSVVVAKLERIMEGGRPQVRLVLEYHSPSRDVPWRSFSAIFSADDRFAVRSYEYEGPANGSSRTEFLYDRHDGLPVFQSRHDFGTHPDGWKGSGEMTVVDQAFGPIPEDEFLPERVLNGPTVNVPVGDDPPEEARTLASWYRVPLFLGMISVICGIGLGMQWPSRSPDKGREP